MSTNINGFTDAVVMNGNMQTAAGVKWTIGKLSTTAADTPLFTTCVADEKPAGIFCDDYAVDRPAALATHGIGKLIVNGATNNIAVGDWIKPTTSGYGILAAHGEAAVGIALDPATADAKAIRIFICPGMAAYIPTTASTTSASPSLSIADLKVGLYNLTVATNGIATLTIPPAASVARGTRIRVLRTVSASAITVDASSGNVNGTTTHTALDAVGDFAIFEADPAGANWFIAHSIIA